ncbi:MAG: hypothetical protein JNL92_00890 [Opitutaceae bacterium]|nr:hypothetical protein [Opitutaceae bacterium]
MTPRFPPLLRSPAFWLLLGVLAAEFWAFDQAGARRHTVVYPRFNDQIQYLTESYTGYEFARTRGVVAGVLNALTNPSAQGTLHDALAVVAFHVTGPSRSAALALNMLALIGWQLALFLAVARTSGSRPLAFAAALLPVALAGPWQNVPGSAFDFRLDHLAMCALGLTAATAVLADGCHSRRGSSWFGIAVGLTLVTRFLTGTYFVLIFAGCALWILCDRGPDRRTRFLHLLRAAILAFVIAGPIFWLNYETVREYYWIGHYVGPESSIRNQHFGFMRSLQYVFGHLGERHLGPVFGAIAVAGGAVFAVCRNAPRQPANGDVGIIGAIFLLAPAAVLILHVQKSEAVLGALAPGVITLVAFGWSWAAQRAGPAGRSVVAGGIALAALVFFAGQQHRPAFTPEQLAELRQVNTFADRIHARWLARPRTPGEPARGPRVAVDYITDALDAQVLKVVIYERHGVLMPLEMTLPTGIAEPTEAEVSGRLAGSDFVFVTEGEIAGPFPYDRKLAALRPNVHGWCLANLRPAERFTLLGRRMVLYQRRDLPFP